MSALEDFKADFAAELDVEPETLTAETELDDLENWDSVMALTAMVLIEQASGQRVSPEQMEALDTYGDIENLIGRLQSG